MRRVNRRDFLVDTAALATLSTLPAVAFAKGRRPKHVIPVDWDGFDPDYLVWVLAESLSVPGTRG